MPDGVITIGIMGTAAIARKIVRAAAYIPDKVKITAVASRDISKADAFISETKLTGAKAIGSYDELLETEIHAVYIPLPCNLHMEWVQKAAERGKHILLEKPVASDEAEVVQMVEIARKYRVVLLDGTMWPHNPRAAAIESLITEIKPIFVRSVFSHRLVQQGDIRLDPKLEKLGALGDLGWYCIRAILTSFNFEVPLSIQGKELTQSENGAIMSCGATLTFSGERTGVFSCSFLEPIQMVWEIQGASKIVRCDDFVIPFNEHTTQLHVTTNPGLLPDHSTPIANTTHTEILTNTYPQETLMLARLAKLITDGDELEVDNWRRVTLKTQAVVSAAYDAILGRKSVTIDADMFKSQIPCHILGVGILSTASIARKGIRAIKESQSEIAVTAVASRELSKAKQFVHEESRNLTDAVAVYGSYQELLESNNVKAVYIPLPTNLHCEWVKKAAEKGKHIVLEKPIALGDSDLDQMVESVITNRVALFDGTMWVHNLRAPKIKEMLQLPEFQTITKVRTHFTFFGDEKFRKNDIRCKKDLDGLGCLGDLGWYCIRFILFVFGYEVPTKVTPTYQIRNEEGVLMECGALVEFSNGKTGEFTCGFTRAFRQFAEIISNESAMEINDFCISERPASITVRKTCMNADWTQGGIERKSEPVHDNLSQESRMWKNFTENVKSGVRGPELFESELTQRVLNAIDRAFSGGDSTISKLISTSSLSQPLRENNPLL